MDEQTRTSELCDTLEGYLPKVQNRSFVQVAEKTIEANRLGFTVNRAHSLQTVALGTAEQLCKVSGDRPAAVKLMTELSASGLISLQREQIRLALSLGSEVLRLVEETEDRDDDLVEALTEALIAYDKIRPELWSRKIYSAIYHSALSQVSIMRELQLRIALANATVELHGFLQAVYSGQLALTVADQLTFNHQRTMVLDTFSHHQSVAVVELQLVTDDNAPTNLQEIALQYMTDRKANADEVLSSIASNADLITPSN